NYTLFTDTGLFTIYLGTDDEKIKRAKKIVLRELDKLKTKGVSENQLRKAKNKFKGQIALAEENRMSMIIAEAKNLMDYDRVITLNEVFEKLDAVSVHVLSTIYQAVHKQYTLNAMAYVPVMES